MEPLASEDSSNQTPTSQGIEVERSNLTNSPVGQAGRDIHQASGDIINNFFNTTQGDWSEEKIEKIRKFEESLRAEFSAKIDKAASLISNLRLCIEHQLTDGNPKDSATILKLIDELKAILGKENKVKEINEDLDFCYQGGRWLQDNKHRLALCAKDYVFTPENLPRLLEHKPKQVSFPEFEQRFLKDLETYITWISVYLKTGKTPQSKDFNEGIFMLNLDLPESVYKEAFIALNNNVVDPVVSGLSTGAANNAASYFNRFIVDRELSKDKPKLPSIFSISKFFSNRIVLLFLMLAVIVIVIILK
jgi:hypothetical protein